MGKRKPGRPRKKDVSDYTRDYGRERHKPVKQRTAHKNRVLRKRWVKKNTQKGLTDAEMAHRTGWDKETIARDRRSAGLYRRKKRR